LIAEVCEDCVRNQLGFTIFQPIKTRETLRQEFQAKNLNMTGLELLRRTVGAATLSINCDRCGTDCLDQHLRLISAWLTPQGEELTSEVCETCVREQVQTQAQFRIQPQQQSAP